MLSYLENRWKSIDEQYRFPVKISIGLGVLLGILLGLLGTATDVDSVIAPTAFQILGYIFLSGYLVWLVFPFISGIYGKLSGYRNILSSTFFGLSISVLSLVSISVVISPPGFSGPPPFFAYISLLFPTVPGAAILLIYYRLTEKSDPLKLNIHVLLAAVVLITVVPTALASNVLLGEQIETDSSDPVEIQACTNTVEALCATHPSETVELPERCESDEAQTQLEQEYRIGDRYIHCPP